MWICSHCGETSEDTFDSCWHCGTGRDGAPPEDPQVYMETASEFPADDTSVAADWFVPGSMAQREPSNRATVAACFICGCVAYTWGHLTSQPTLTTRRCDICGNVQLFDVTVS